MTSTLFCYDCGRPVQWHDTDTARQYAPLCGVHYRYRMHRHLGIRSDDVGDPVDSPTAELLAAPRAGAVHWRPRDWLVTACGISIQRHPTLTTVQRRTACTCARCQTADILAVIPEKRAI